MVNIEMAAIEKIAAVLACIVIPLKDIVSRKFDLLFRKTVEET